jgi:hypothetical protein
MRLAALAALLALAAPADPPVLAPAEIDSPAPPGSAQPQLSVTHDGRVVLSWIEKAGQGRHRFRLALGSVVSGVSRTGIRWTAPSTIAEGDNFFANWADVPSVVALPDGALAAHWLQMSGPGTYAYDVILRHSTDSGKTWSEPARPHRDGTETEHGFVSIVPWPEGGYGLVWLDGRDFAKHAGGSHGPEGMNAEMSLRATTFASNRRAGLSGPPALRQGPEMLVDGRVCECCPTAAARTDRGVVVAYRDRSADEIRDISVTRYEHGKWTPGTPVFADNWTIPGCPVNGPSLSASGRRVALAWFAAPENKARVSVAFSNDGGATFGRPIRVDDGPTPLGRVDAELLADGAALVAWMEYVKDASAEVRVRRVSPDGSRGESTKVASVTSERTSGYPRMVRAGDRIVFAWVAAGANQQTAIKVAVAKAPPAG